MYGMVTSGQRRLQAVWWLSVSSEKIPSHCICLRPFVYGSQRRDVACLAHSVSMCLVSGIRSVGMATAFDNITLLFTRADS